MCELKNINTPGEIAELLEKVQDDMTKGGSSPTDRARAIKAIAEYFGIDVIKDFVLKDTQKRKKRG